MPEHTLTSLVCFLIGAFFGVVAAILFCLNKWYKEHIDALDGLQKSKQYHHDAARRLENERINKPRIY